MEKLQWLITKDSCAIHTAREILLAKGLHFTGLRVYALKIVCNPHEPESIMVARKLFRIAYRMKLCEGFQSVEKFSVITYNPKTENAEYLRMATFVLSAETYSIH